MKKYLKNVHNRIKSFFGLKGSWRWSIRQMKNGKIIKDTSSVCIKLRLSVDAQQRIECAFTHTPFWENTEWTNAFFSVSNLESCEYEVCELDWHKKQ